MIVTRKMEIEDLDRVLEVEKDCFKSPWSRDSLSFEIRNNSLATYLVGEYDGLVVAYGGMWVILDEGHITNIAVISDYRGRGLGDRILYGLIEKARELDLARLTLEVRVSNLPAQKLYEKYGFVSHGIRPNYYGDNGEDAIIMWKNLKE